MKSIKLFGLALLSITMISSCVSERKYSELKAQYDDCTQRKDKLTVSLKDAEEQLKTMKEENEDMKKQIASLRLDSAECYMSLNRTKKLYNDLQELQQRILANTKDEQEKTRRDLMETSELLKEREKDVLAKEQELREIEKQIYALQRDLSKREARVKELEDILHAKDSAVQSLKEQMQKALFDFQGNGLVVEVRNGKVYVSMDEKLLFKSGSTEVDPEGRKALLELAKAVMEQEDITIMVEGHTDNVPMKSANIKDNWDLSVLRATSIVRILTVEGKLNPTRVFAAGRGEYFPIAPNDTPETRAQNRRTEIIMTPKLDELIEILSN